MRHFSTLLNFLQPLGLFVNDEFPWSVYLYDLEIISKIIQHPSIFLHYLEQRIETQKEKIFIHMEELQLLSWYLNFINLHPFGIDPENKTISIATTASAYEKFDDYFLYKRGPKPELNLDKKILKIIKTLEKKPDYGYTDEVSDLLNSLNRNLLNMNEPQEN